ncbi:hypothetical protein GCM10010266_48990 [Streptomyces griseomycini]|nr:hypothetical protein GCM10010266_48990 [Streptomyces griseomycini]GGR12063.1 hypothetical protein GCM10015536_17000 [Streptomyces griseomycini]
MLPLFRVRGCSRVFHVFVAVPHVTGETAVLGRGGVVVRGRKGRWAGRTTEEGAQAPLPLAYRKLSTGRDAILTEWCERGDSGRVPEGLGEGAVPMAHMGG